MKYWSKILFQISLVENFSLFVTGTVSVQGSASLQDGRLLYKDDSGQGSASMKLFLVCNIAQSQTRKPALQRDVLKNNSEYEVTLP